MRGKIGIDMIYAKKFCKIEDIQEQGDFQWNS